MEETFKKKYLKCKYKVKKWESEFKGANGTNPSKTDIKNAPSHIKEAYRTYWKLKTLSLETSLVDVSFDIEDTMDGFSTMDDGTQNSTESRPGEITLNDDSMLESYTPENSATDVTLDSISLSCAVESLKSCEVGVKQSEDKYDKNFDGKGGNGDVNNKSVWGPHLSNKGKTTEDKPKVDKRSVLSRFTEKLFAGATFKKRNPRKSLVRREKSVNSESQLEDSFSSVTSEPLQSLSQPESSLHAQDNSVKEESKSEYTESDSLSFDVNCSFKVVNSSRIGKSCQPMSVLHKSLSENGPTKQVLTRTVDKGWLERLDKVNTIETKNKVNSSDSGIELTSPKSSPQRVSVPANDHGFSEDEDFVCDSDSDSERTFSSLSSLRTKSFSRFQNTPNNAFVSDFKRACVSLSSISQPETKPLISKSEKRMVELEGEDSSCKKSKLDIVSSDDSYSHSCSRSTLSSNICTTSQECNNSSTNRVESKSLSEIQINTTKKTKAMIQEEVLKKKIRTGKVNENFVKINIQKKTYVRGKKTMTFQKYKKQKWKAMKKSQGFGGKGLSKCFKCGDVGHFAKDCIKDCDQLMPIEDLNYEDDSPFPTLNEAEEMANEASKKICVKRNINELPVHVAKENFDPELVEPPQPLVVSDDLMRFVTEEPIFKPNDDGSVIDTPLMVLEALMEFGFESWRPGQETAVMRVLSGLSTLVTLSTGAGKSLCYQLPAYLYHNLQQRITIVVSPLVSLMEDQVFCGSSCLRIACLHTGQSPKVQEAVYADLRANTLHALLVSPETLTSKTSELLRSLPPVAFACIDEVHCISQWSHNFRPSYLMVCQVLKEKFGVKTMLGLTATATCGTVDSVSGLLGLPGDGQGVVRDTPLPDHLQLSVSRDRNKDAALVQLLSGPRFRDCQSVIVYCTRRDVCERLAAFLRTSLQDVSREDGVNKRGKLSWNAEAYHAGLTAARRKAVQKAFISGKTRIVVATVAFGMGINKQDIHGIIHYNMPSAFERYVQEVGRAGRDGQTAHCHLFLNTEGEDLRELRRHIYADSVERHTIRKLLQRVFVACNCGSKCTPHEVAFSVNETVTALDLPEENIATLLCYLELHQRQWVHVCSMAYTRARILSYKGPRLIKQAVKECPPLAVAVATELKKGVKLEKVTKLEFPIFPVAAAINWDSGIIKQQLKSLEWTKVNGQPRRSGLNVEFCDLGFRVQAPGNLTAEELDATLDYLTQRVECQELMALQQLQTIFNVLLRVSHESVDECLDKVDQSRSEILKTEIREYFSKDNQLISHSFPEEELQNEDQVVSDIRSLVNCYRDISWSGRAVARILHGIVSPNYGAQQWGRTRFWRSHLHEDFRQICRLATHELIKMR